MILNNAKKIHFIGIGGTGVSAAAAYVRELGLAVTGSDISESVYTKELRRRGVQIHIGTHKAVHIDDTIDLIIYSNAVKDTNIEIKKGRRLNITILKYSEFIGKLAEKFHQIIITGTHGKSTISAMLSSIFVTAGMDPSVIVGANITELHSNARVGLSRNFIIEGDEYRDAFLQYNPTALLVNNIEADHLDYFKNEKNIIQSFRKLIQKVPRGGTIIANADDENVMNAVKNVKCKLLTFGMKSGNYYIHHIDNFGELSRITVRGVEEFELSIRVPGSHNALNALGACVMAISFGIDILIIKKGLLQYSGAERRFEIIGRKKGVTIIDDYAHHPTAVKAVLKTARSQYPGRRIWCIFEPHSIDRLKNFENEFIEALANCDKLIVTDIYKVPGRETTGRFDLSKITDKVKNKGVDARSIKQKSAIVSHIIKNKKRGDVILFLGAGSITDVSDLLLKNL